MFDFDAFADLTGSFNDAVCGVAATAAPGFSVASIFSLVSDRPRNQEVERPLKAAAKLSLLPRLF